MGQGRLCQKVWQILEKIPRGKVTTYKEIAKYFGNEKLARVIGNALNKNPFSPKLPCHRVVNNNGRIGGYAKGLEKKIELLKKEGILVISNKINDFEKNFFKF